MRCLTPVFALILAAGCAAGEAFSFGVKGGIPLSDPTRWKDESRPYIVGPTVEFRLPIGFAVEASALYSRIGFHVSAPPTQFFNRTRGNSWEFPLLGKKYFGSRSRSWRPFLGTGWSFRTVDYTTEGRTTGLDPERGNRSFPYSLENRSDLAVGAVFAGGVRFHAGRLALTPEVRYTRWGSETAPLRKNQVGAFLSLTF